MNPEDVVSKALSHYMPKVMAKHVAHLAVISLIKAGWIADKPRCACPEPLPQPNTVDWDKALWNLDGGEPV